MSIDVHTAKRSMRADELKINYEVLLYMYSDYCERDIFCLDFFLTQF